MKADFPIRHGLAFLGFLVVTGVFMAPVAPDPGSLALGHPGNDVWNHVWGYWWVTQELAQGRVPLHTSYLRWPAGGALWFIDSFGAILATPVTRAWGPVAAYNAVLAFDLWLCGAGAYLLALSVTRHWGGSFVAGIAFMTMPHLLGQAYNGISETLAAGWLPLAVLGLRNATHHPTPGRGAVAGLAVGVAFLANWYYGLFALMVGVGLVCRGVLRTLRPTRYRGGFWLLLLSPLSPHRTALVHQVRSALAVLFWGGLVMSVVMAVPLWWFLTSLDAQDAIVSRDRTFVWTTLVLHNMTDLVSLVRPGKHYSPDFRSSFGEDLIVVVYLGHALLLPALWALWTNRRRVRWWGGMALCFGILSLGPFLYLGGDYLRVGPGWLPLPFLALHEFVPGFSRVSHSYRFVVGASLALTIMLALCVRQWSRGRISAVVVPSLLVALRLAETLWGSAAVFPLPTARVEVPAIYAEISDGAVLDLPMGLQVLERAEYGMYQFVHKQPIPYGLNDPYPEFMWTNRYMRYIVEVEQNVIGSLPTSMPWLDLLLGREEARAAGLRWVVLHRERLSVLQWERLSSFLDLTATRVHDGQTQRVYRLDST